MSRSFNQRPSPALVVALLALFVALGGGALAATSFIGSDGQVHGCVDKKGHLKLVKAGAKCGTGKSRIAWNQQGPRGLRGATGPSTGPAGGDLTGNYPAPTIRAVSRNPVTGSAPLDCNPPPNTGQFCRGLANWENYGNGYATAEFFKDRLGLVHLQGSVVGQAAIPIFYLPQGYRPGAKRLFIVRNDSASSGSGYVTIGTDGSVASDQDAAYLSLDGISFAP